MLPATSKVASRRPSSRRQPAALSCWISEAAEVSVVAEVWEEDDPGAAPDEGDLEDDPGDGDPEDAPGADDPDEDEADEPDDPGMSWSDDIGGFERLF